MVDRKSERREEKEREKEKNCHRCEGCTYAYFSLSSASEKGWAGRERAKRGESEKEREGERCGGCNSAFKWNFDVFFNCCFDDVGIQIWHSNLLVQP